MIERNRKPRKYMDRYPSRSSNVASAIATTSRAISIHTNCEKWWVLLMVNLS